MHPIQETIAATFYNLSICRQEGKAISSIGKEQRSQMPIDHLVITSNSVIGYSSNSKFDEKAFSAHLTEHLRKDGIKDITIKIFDDYNKYLNRLSELNNLDDETTAVNIGVRNLILNITL